MFAYLNEAIRACDQALGHQGDLAGACRTLGNVLQALGRFEEAMDWQSRSVQPQLDRAELLCSLGKLYAQQENWTEAIAAYQQALSLQPDHAAACWSLSNIYAQLKQPTEELKYRQQSLTLRAEWATSQNYLSLGNRFVAQDWLEEAVATYRSALQVEPGFVEAQHNLAVALSRQGELDAATAAYHSALELHPEHSQSYFGLGKALEQQERWPEAIAAYRQAIDLNPNFVSAVYALAALLFMQGEADAAITVYQRAIELLPTFAWSYHHLGVALVQQRQYAEATIALRQAIDLNPTFTWTYYHLATALCRQQQWQAVITVALTAIQLQPSLTEIYPLLGQAIRQQLQQQDLSDLIQIYRQTAPVAPEHATAQFYQQLGETLMQQRQFEAALLFYELAAQECQHSLTLETKINQATAAKDQRLQTIATQRQRLTQTPHLPQPYIQLGNLLAEQGEWEEAVRLSQQANVLQGWTQASQKQYEFTWDWFSHQLPSWQIYLKPLIGQAGLNALEIGSFEGRSTCWLLDQVLTAADSQITCIDLCFQDRFHLNLDRTHAQAKVIKRQGYPLDLLQALPVCDYDLIHLDGGSLTERVEQYVALCWQRLKSGGILIIDDYQLQDSHHAIKNLKLAIDSVLSTIQTESEILYQAYQLIIRKSVCLPVSD